MRKAARWISRMSSLLLQQCTDFGSKCPCGNGMLLRHPGLGVCPLCGSIGIVTVVYSVLCVVDDEVSQEEKGVEEKEKVIRGNSLETDLI